MNGAAWGIRIVRSSVPNDAPVDLLMVEIFPRRVENSGRGGNHDGKETDHQGDHQARFQAGSELDDDDRRDSDHRHGIGKYKERIEGFGDGLVDREADTQGYGNSSRERKARQYVTSVARM